MIVPMTVVDPAVFAEITAGARVFPLTAPSATITTRIDGGDKAHEWRHQNLDRCLRAFATDDFGKRIDTDGRTPLEVAELIAAAR